MVSLTIRFLNNFVNVLYQSFIAAKDTLQKSPAVAKPGANEYDGRLRNFIMKFSQHVREFSEPAKGSFKLSGVESDSFIEYHSELIAALDPRKDTKLVMTLLIDFFTLISKSRDDKFKSKVTYLKSVKDTTREIIVRWKLRFGSENIENKEYLHNLQHISDTEKYCLENGLPTLESYCMQGREHINKEIAAYANRHYPGEEESKRRGRKTDEQKAEELFVMQNVKDKHMEVDADMLKYSGSKGTKAEIDREMPGYGLSKLKKSEAVAKATNLKKKEVEIRKDCHV
jgi:hypothetical protein